MKLIITSALLFLTVSSLAQAKHNNSYLKGSHNNPEVSRSTYKAKVINSTPIYKYLTASQPQEYCKPTVTVKSHNKGGVIVGGIIGAVIGHGASDKNHKNVGAIVGAVIGSSLVQNMKNISHKHTNSYTVKQHSCASTYNNPSKIRILDGYNVTYRSQGKIYRTFRPEKPAKYIRIYN